MRAGGFCDKKVSLSLMAFLVFVVLFLAASQGGLVEGLTVTATVEAGLAGLNLHS